VRRRRLYQGTIAGVACIIVAALAVSAHKTIAGSCEQEGEHEALAYHGTTACGVERWFVKVGMDSDARLVNQQAVVPSSIFHLRPLPAPASLPLRNRIRPTETTVFSISGTLLRVKEEQDSDYQLVLADSGGRTMITEIPAPGCVGSSSPLRFMDISREPSRAGGLLDEFDTVGLNRHRKTEQWAEAPQEGQQEMPKPPVDGMDRGESTSSERALRSAVRRVVRALRLPR
jgi:hypothetical protein